MTTIVWTGSEVAADSRSVMNEAIAQRPFNKLIEHKGVIYAISGNVAHGLAVIQWLKSGADSADVPDHIDWEDVAVLQIEDDVTGYIWSGGPYPLQVDPPLCLGTGMHFALGALETGADAHGAVTIACRLDNNSGAPVNVRKVRARKNSKQRS